MKFSIRSVLWLFDGMKGVSDFWPLRMAGKGEEEIQLVALPYNGYCYRTFWCRYLWFPMKKGGRITFLHDLTSSGLIAVVKSTQLSIRTILFQEDTTQITEIPACISNTICNSG